MPDKDKWSSLSLKQKAEVIKIMVGYGITHPSEIKSIYESFTKEPSTEPTTPISKDNTALGSGFTKRYEDLPPAFKEQVDRLAAEYNVGSDIVEEYYNSGYLNPMLKARLQVEGSGRLRDNDSPTSQKSEELEGMMNKMVYNNSGKDRPNLKYAIPYLMDKEIKIPGVGRTSENALDSLAKYAAKTDITLNDALGLFGQETTAGAQPYINYDSYGKEKKHYEDIASDSKEFENILGNSSYFRNYGVEPSENIVRDFAYGDNKVSYDVPPLEHAFKYFLAGRYNPKDPNHTSDVKSKGRAMMKTKVIQDWISRSEYAKAALNNK